MITPKIILLKLLPSLIIAAAILLGLFVLAKKVEKTLQTTINTYLEQVQVSQSNRNSEIDFKIAQLAQRAEDIARGSRFQYAIDETKSVHRSSPEHYLFDSLTGAVLKRNHTIEDWNYPQPQIPSRSDWTNYVEGTESRHSLKGLLQGRWGH